MEDESWQKPWALCCRKFMEKRGSGNTQDLSWHSLSCAKERNLAPNSLGEKDHLLARGNKGQVYQPNFRKRDLAVLETH